MRATINNHIQDHISEVRSKIQSDVFCLRSNFHLTSSMVASVNMITFFNDRPKFSLSAIINPIKNTVITDFQSKIYDQIATNIQ